MVKKHELENVFFYTIEKAIKSYRQYAQRRFNEAGIYITIDQWLVLNYISQHEECYQHEIAEAVFKDNASVTRIIEILVGSDLLLRKIHEKDRRRFQLTLTQSGLDLVKKTRKVVMNNRKAGAAGIKEKDLVVAEKVLHQIIENCSLQ